MGNFLWLTLPLTEGVYTCDHGFELGSLGLVLFGVCRLTHPVSYSLY